jgi:hypothetical protein
MAIGSRKEFKGAAPATSLASSMTAGALSFTVAAGEGASYPDGTDGDFPIDIDYGTATAERVLCESRSGDVFTVKTGGRGHDGTTAQAHSPTTGQVTHGIDAESMNDLMDHVYDTTRVAHPSVVHSTETANYTLVSSDAGKVIEMNSASARTITVPPNSSVAFPTGTVIELFRLGAGTVTVAAGSGVTINSPGGLLAIDEQYGTVTLRKRATDSWVLEGRLG